MNEKPATFEETIVLYDKLIKNQIKQLTIYQHFDDYYQIGLIALWDAYQKFDSTKGSFSAYAKSTVRGNLLTALKKEHTYIQFHQLYDTIIPELLQDKWQIDSVLQKEIIEVYCKRLSKNQQKVIFGRFYYQKTFEEIAHDEQVPLSLVRSWYKHAINKLKLHRFS
jgi:RNA polymerase sigma factor (sigma-70 family)